MTVTWGRLPPPEAGALTHGPWESLQGAGRRLCDTQDATPEHGPPPAPSAYDTLASPVGREHVWSRANRQLPSRRLKVLPPLLAPSVGLGSRGSGGGGLTGAPPPPLQTSRIFSEGGGALFPRWEQSQIRPKSMHPGPKGDSSQPASPALRTE